MSDLNLSQTIFLLAVAIYTTTAAVYDCRFRRIPNRLTIPMCVTGLIFQAGFFGLSGLQDALLGFLTGFGILFVLWMIGSAGGGDVKLLGGLSVWLGAGLTLKVLFCSLVLVVLGTAATLIVSLSAQGLRRTKTQYLNQAAAAKHRDETSEQRARRRVMAFAMPVALATWCVLGLYRHQLQLFQSQW